MLLRSEDESTINVLLNDLRIVCATVLTKYTTLDPFFNSYDDDDMLS